MAEVNYKATTSSDDQQNDEPSVEILDPKINSISVTFSDTIESKDPDKSLDLDQINRPSSALWKQQKLPAWQPILTSDTVLPAFFLLGVALVPIGVGLLISSNYVKEFSHEYTDCVSEDNINKCSDIIAKSLNKSVKCRCWFKFNLDDDFNAPVFFYYGLSSFYQNHRRYVRSYSDKQLKGKVGVNLEDCEPYDKVGNKEIAPCGAIANSFFNDTFKLFMRTGNTVEPIDLAQTDIAWPTDKEIKYNNPPDEAMRNYNYANPPFWQKGETVFDLDHNHPDNNGYKNEHLIVWMRTAALPSFRKLWARIDHDQNILWRTKLPKGNYTLLINYNYPMIYKDWKGGKHIYISNTSWLGGKNNFLGYAYIAVGVICLVLWLSFLIIIKNFGQNPKDIVDIGPKTTYAFTPSKPEDSTDSSRQPLRSRP